MEKPIMANVCRACATIITLLLAAVATQAQLINGGFEDNSGTQTASGWNFINNAAVTATNDLNLTPDPIRAHSGAYSLNTYNPGGACNPGCPGSLATQDIGGPTVGQTYKFYGYVLNWSGARLMLATTTTVGFAEAQMVFLDATNGVIALFTTPEYGMQVPLPLNQWQAFEVIGTTPANAATVRLILLYVGSPGASGSAWWDDVRFAPVTGVTNVVAATVQPGVQISYPTSVGTYVQPQSSVSLNPAAWTAFGPETQGVGITNQFTDVVGTSTNKFYKITQVP
jgi:hypothetical protein